MAGPAVSPLGWWAVAMLTVGLVLAAVSAKTFRSNRKLSDLLLPVSRAFLVFGVLAAVIAWALG